MRKRSRIKVCLLVTEMEVKLQLSVFVLLIQVSLAVWQRVTVLKGQTLSLRCPITSADKTHVDWKNPEGYVMFFNHNHGEYALKDKRYSINKLSQSEFSISVSSVTFKDGGNYTCTHYGHQTTEKTVEVTVLGYPKMSKTKDEGKTVIKCTAEGNHFPPQISWKIDEGSEFQAYTSVQLKDKKYTSSGIIEILSVEKRLSVKCLVRHPALHSQTLMSFVKIGRDSKQFHRTTTTSSPTAPGSTQVLESRTSWIRHGRITVYLTTGDGNRPSPESSTVHSGPQFSSSDPNMVTTPATSPLSPVTATGPHLSTSDDSRTSVLPGSTRMSSDEAMSTTGWTYVSENTENITIDNSTDCNKTGNPGLNMHREIQGNSSVLVLLVTCLISGLLVVVIFFAIKLRRAHIAWKRENEDSNPSEESSKSKSSHEEKSSQGQRRRGLFNTAFTQYVVEEPTGTMTSVQNTAAITATETVNNGHTSQPQTTAQTSAKSDIKETSL